MESQPRAKETKEGERERETALTDMHTRAKFVLVDVLDGNQMCRIYCKRHGSDNTRNRSVWVEAPAG